MSASTPVWETIVSDVTAIISAISPVLDLASPAAGSAIAVVGKVIAGIAAAEPTAVALVSQIANGTPATAAQLQTVIAAYEAAYQKLDADIAARLPRTTP